MEAVVQPMLFAGAVAAAAALGVCLCRAWRAWRRRVRYRVSVQQDEASASSWIHARAQNAQLGTSPDERLIAYALGVDRRIRSPLFKSLAPAALQRRPWIERWAAPAGLEGQLSSAGFWEARVRLAALGALAGCAVGLLVSLELAVCLTGVGLVGGWRALQWAIRQRVRKRAEGMERNLSEMLDVVALGMRSGLSFDRSLQLYTEHFHTLLADSFRSAHRQWSCGLASRETALRSVAASYASPLLARVIENIVRSLRFGSALAGNLEDAAREARCGYRARKQEQVAKAPVKMMIPTGVLILPAMLILVLGPVLLELAGGF